MSEPNAAHSCRRMLREGDSIWCIRLKEWLEPEGLECHRCRHGLPVRTQDFRDALRAVKDAEMGEDTP